MSPRARQRRRMAKNTIDRWRVGRTSGKTIYRDEESVGRADTREVAKMLVDAANAAEIRPPVSPLAKHLTYEEIEQACRNVGLDLRCGSCACLFFTGFGGYDHMPGCKSNVAPADFYLGPPNEEADLIRARTIDALRITALTAENEKLCAALKPIARIADEADNEGLDEWRPSWAHTPNDPKRVELYAGRGGKELLTLADVYAARDALKGK